MRKSLIVAALALTAVFTPAALADDGDSDVSPSIMEIIGQLWGGVVSYSRVIFIVD